MRMVDLFSGIGGFSIAAQWCWGDELEIEAFVEIDPFCQKVLRKNFSGVPIYDDIKKIQWVVANTESRKTITTKSGGLHAESRVEIRKPRIDLLTGGFPCQPFSCAGKRAGTEDDRYLWPEMLRTIHEVKPRWVVAENVSGLLSMQDGMVFEGVCADLEAEGYSVQSLIIPACAQGAPHRRDRVWIIGYSSSTGRQQIPRGAHENEGEHEGRSAIQGDQSSSSDQDALYAKSKRTQSIQLKRQGDGTKQSDCHAPDTDRPGSQIGEVFGRNFREECKAAFGNPWQENWYEVATRLCRVDDGVSPRMDRVNRLKALGNSIVPQIALQIFRAIKEFDTW